MRTGPRRARQGAAVADPASSRAAPRVLAAILLVFVPLVVASTLAEMIVRWREWHRVAPPGTQPTLYYLHQRLRPSLVRNQDYFGWMHIDSSGMRGRDVALAHPPGVTRILADGGSTTFDVAVTADDSTWPAQLERQLRARHPGPIEVLNGGVPGYVVLDNILRLQTDLYRFSPDVVILLQGHNDLYDVLVQAESGDPNRPQEHEARTPWTYWLAKHSLLFGKLEGARRAIAGRWGPGRGTAPGLDSTIADSLIAAGAARFKRDLATYVFVARMGGAQVILLEPIHLSAGALVPRDSAEDAAWRRAFAGVPGSVVLRGYDAYGKAMREVALEDGATFLGVTAWGMDRAELYSPGDPIHFNDAGARKLAERLTIVIDSLNLLEPARRGDAAVPR